MTPEDELKNSYPTGRCATKANIERRRVRRGPGVRNTKRRVINPTEKGDHGRPIFKK